MKSNGDAADREDPLWGLYLLGWCITIGNVPGFVGGIDETDRKDALGRPAAWDAPTHTLNGIRRRKEPHSSVMLILKKCSN